ISFFSAGGVECTEIGSSFPAIERDDALSIRRPNRRETATTARCAVIAADSAAQVPIEIRGEIFRLRIRREVHYPQVRLGVRAHGLIRRRIESDSLSVGTDGKPSRTHIEGGELRRWSTGNRDVVNVRLTEFVVRLVAMIGNKID